MGRLEPLLDHTMKDGHVQTASAETLQDPLQDPLQDGLAAGAQGPDRKAVTKRIRKLKRKRAGAKLKRGLASAVDHTLLAPIHAVDALSNVDRHAKDFGRYVKTGKTWRSRLRDKEGEYADSTYTSFEHGERNEKWKRKLGRTGLRGFLNTGRRTGDKKDKRTPKQKETAQRRQKYNPFWQLSRVGNSNKPIEELDGQIAAAKAERDGVTDEQ